MAQVKLEHNLMRFENAPRVYIGSTLWGSYVLDEFACAKNVSFVSVMSTDSLAHLLIDTDRHMEILRGDGARDQQRWEDVDGSGWLGF